jgi:hypothetical protein
MRPSRSSTRLAAPAFHDLYGPRIRRSGVRIPPDAHLWNRRTPPRAQAAGTQFRRAARTTRPCSYVAFAATRAPSRDTPGPPLTPWESVEYFRDMRGRYGEIGIDELVLSWPRKWRVAPHEVAVFEEVAREVMPALRSEP